MIGIIKVGDLNYFYAVPLPKGFEIDKNVGNYYDFIKGDFKDPTNIKIDLFTKKCTADPQVFAVDHIVPLKMKSYFQLSNALLYANKLYDKRTDKLITRH